MSLFNKVWRKPRTEKNLVSYSGSGSPVSTPISGLSTNTASNEQKTVIVPMSDTQQTARSSPHSIAHDPTEKKGLRSIYIPISTSDTDDDRVRNSLDIVAVHGITGNAYDTWIHHNGTFWLQDLIPKDFPGVRVFSYGYPADVFCTFATGTIDTFARSLLENLKGERRNKDVCSLLTSL
ncbi:hypothetical protein BGZ60DRAFT_421057 [Tricladium varicosporioides]|nr:hypothetical protein BGZ60DRAFT_421057 [Hymenoscyphus varicosporioides]